MRQIVTLTRSDAPNAFVQGVLCALLLLVALPVWSQSEFCLEGTVWDATLGGCIPEESCAVKATSTETVWWGRPICWRF